MHTYLSALWPADTTLCALCANWASVPARSGLSPCNFSYRYLESWEVGTSIINYCKQQPSSSRQGSSAEPPSRSPCFPASDFPSPIPSLLPAANRYIATYINFSIYHMQKNYLMRCCPYPGDRSGYQWWDMDGISVSEFDLSKSVTRVASMFLSWKWLKVGFHFF